MIKRVIPLTLGLSMLAAIPQAQGRAELDKLFALCTKPNMTLGQRVAAAQGLFTMGSHNGDRVDLEIAIWEEAITLAVLDAGDEWIEEDRKDLYQFQVTSARGNPGANFGMGPLSAYLENSSGSYALNIFENKDLNLIVCLFVTRYPVNPVRAPYKAKKSKTGPAGDAVYYRIPKTRKIKALIAETIYPSTIYSDWVPDRPLTTSITRITTRFAD